MCDKYLNNNNIKSLYKTDVYCECCKEFVMEVDLGKEKYEYICDNCWRELNGIKYPNTLSG